jgi:cold shock CspA family protein
MKGIKGRLKQFCPDKHYGFLATDDPRVDVFCHANIFFRCGIMHPVVGQTYRYDAEPSTRKPGRIQACRVWELEGVEAERELAWLRKQQEDR